MLPTIDWQDDAIVMVDQRKLPGQELYLRCRTAQEVARAIRTMVIRGAPAIGVAAAMGIALGMRKSTAKGTRQFAVDFQKICDMMASTRPTAVNLFWAIERMKRYLQQRGYWSEAFENETQEKAKAALNDAIKRAEARPAPKPESMFDDVYLRLTPQLEEQRAELARLGAQEETEEGAFPL